MNITRNDPLDGAEIKEIILQRIKAALEKDCTLQSDIAYPGFSFNFDINLKFLRSGVKETMVWGTDTVGTQPTDVEVEDGKVQTDIVSGEFAAIDSPNTVREQHNMGIPMDVTLPGGGVERRKIKVGRPRTNFEKVNNE